MLSLPYVLKLNGYVLGIFLMVLGAVAAKISLKMLARLADTHNQNDFSKLAEMAGGKYLRLLL